MVCPFPVVCPQLCSGCGSGSEPASATAIHAAAGTLQAEGSALLSTDFHPPCCFGVGLEGEAGGLCEPAALGSAAAPAAAGGQELCGKVDTQKGFKSQINEVSAVGTRLFMCNLGVAVSVGLVILYQRTSKTMTAAGGDQQETECRINPGEPLKCLLITNT